MRSSLRSLVFLGLGLAACGPEGPVAQPQELLTPVIVSAPEARLLRDDQPTLRAVARGLAGPDAAAAALDRLASQVSGVRLAVQYVRTDELGLRHVRAQQTWNDVPVLHGDTIVHSDQAGAVYAISGALVANVRVSTSPTVAADDARGILRKHLLARLPALPVGDADALPLPELQILPGEARDRLVWRSSVFIEGDELDPMKLEVLVDAHSGELLQVANVLETTAATGTGKSLYLGTVAIGTNSIAKGYEMRDQTRGGTYTINMNNKQNGGSIFTDTDNVWGNSLNNDPASAGVDAHFGTAATWDYYRAVHGRNGIANDGKGAYNRVHYGRRYNNAFWSDSCFCMTYGDGDGTSFSPLVSLDVAGHEMSHGVTSRTANLTYSGESGGLNEATSDIFGTCTEFYANNASDAPDYLIGEKITLTGNRYLRNMAHPRQDGSSIDHYSLYRSGMDVHYSSGIANNFFYLLSEGGTNDTSRLTVTGIGRDKAEKIWYRALTTYMTSGTNFAGARTQTLRAAADLYGAGSAEQAAVAATWTACGVN